jgi:AcrR family transcriptional regulator
MPKITGGLRASHKLRTQRSIQDHAMRLFTERGYDSTTIADIAKAADVSSMTVFRYFPTKEDLVMGDEYDPIIVEKIQAQPPWAPLIRRICQGLVEVAAERTPEDEAMLLARIRMGLSVPSLRARMWDGQFQSQQRLVAGLRTVGADPQQDLELQVATGASLAAAAAAIMRWADGDGQEDLPALMDSALRMLWTDDTSIGGTAA